MIKGFIEEDAEKIIIKTCIATNYENVYHEISASYNFVKFASIVTILL
jgi:hypothetical protein